MCQDTVTINNIIINVLIIFVILRKEILNQYNKVYLVTAVCQLRDCRVFLQL